MSMRVMRNREVALASPSDRAIAARVLCDAEHSTGVIAELLGVSESQVRRYLAAVSSSEPEHSALEDLESLLAAQDLDDLGRMNAGIARRLASKLDRASTSDKAADAMAVPALAKELRAVVAEIMGTSSDDKAWLADVFAPVGDASQP